MCLALAPPPEKFWGKYSPHHEFPLSSIGSLALHVAGLVVFVVLLWLLARSVKTDAIPVPMVGVVISEESEAENRQGDNANGNENRREDVQGKRNPSVEDRLVPIPAPLKDEVSQWLPNVPVATGAPSVDTLPTLRKLAELNEDLRRAFLKNNQDSKKPNDPTSSQSRSIRWLLLFDFETGRDSLDQMSSLRATLVIPLPPKERTVMVYSDLRQDRPKGVVVDDLKKVPKGCLWINRSRDWTIMLAEELRLGFVPSTFLFVLPKDIEEHIAAIERGYRGRKESEIFSTTFAVKMNNGNSTIVVTEQVPVRR